MADVMAKSIELSELFIAEVARRCPALTLASPIDPHQRGSHVSFHFDHGYPLMQALIAAKVIGDFRAPNIIRFGIAPLFNDTNDIMTAVDRMEKILRDETWKETRFQTRSAVT